MLFIINAEGTVQKTFPSQVYQGSNDASDIIVLAPIVQAAMADVGFMLPNGVWTTPYIMASNGPIELEGVSYNTWRTLLPYAITEYSGTVTAQFRFYTGAGADPQTAQVVATAATTFTVQAGAAIQLPGAPTDDVYDQILSEIARLTKIRYINLQNGEGLGSLMQLDTQNKAIGENSIALGYGTVAGVKGFLVSNIEKETNDGLSYYNEGTSIKITLDSVAGLELDDVISLRYYSDLDYLQYSGNIATITAITGNVITAIIAEGKRTSRLFQKVDSPADNQKSYLWVVAKPEIGGHLWFSAQHSEGHTTIAVGTGSHAEGAYTVANGQYAHAEGYDTYTEYCCHAEGRFTKALGESSHSEGYETEATGYSHAEGIRTKSLSSAAHAEGRDSTASGSSSHAEGDGTKATEDSAHAEGYATTASGEYSHSEGISTTASGQGSHAEGGFWYNEGTNVRHGTVASGTFAHAEGAGAQATGEGSHAEGRGVAKGKYSHSEGNSEANGNASHAEGTGVADGECAHAEGIAAKATGRGAHAEGDGCIAQTTSYDYTAPHAEGRRTQALSVGAHSGGSFTKAIGEESFVHGKNLVNYNNSAFLAGQYGSIKKDSGVLFAVANGDSYEADSKEEQNLGFKFFKDGHAELQSAGTTPQSVVRNADIDKVIASLESVSISVEISSLTWTSVGQVGPDETTHIGWAATLPELSISSNYKGYIWTIAQPTANAVIESGAVAAIGLEKSYTNKVCVSGSTITMMNATNPAEVYNSMHYLVILLLA